MSSVMLSLTSIAFLGTAMLLTGLEYVGLGDLGIMIFLFLIIVAVND